MLKPRSLHLTVDTPNRIYEVSWFNDKDTSPLTPGTAAEITVRVVTTGVNGCLFTENFTIPAFESATNITGTKDLHAWFYGEFAYQYADLHANDEDTGCLRASILYDLGNYKIAQRDSENKDEAVMGPTKSIHDDFCDARDKSKIFYVCMNDGSSTVYCFSSYDNAEQWANEKLYQTESINVAINVASENLPYTIFTVEGVKARDEFSDAPLDLPCSEEQSKSKREDNPLDIPSTRAEPNTKIYEENIWVETTEGEKRVYYLTQKQLDEIIKNFKS